MRTLDSSQRLAVGYSVPIVYCYDIVEYHSKYIHFFIREAFRLTLIRRIRQNGKDIRAKGKLNAFLKNGCYDETIHWTNNNEIRTQQKIETI